MIREKQICPLCKKRVLDILDGSGKIIVEMICPNCHQRVEVILHYAKHCGCNNIDIKESI